MEDIFITGIDTNVGKTVVSSLFVELFQCDYWKPIQCGDLDTPDKETVNQMVHYHKPYIHPEAYSFKTPLSPHIASQKENIQIDLKKIHRPGTSSRLIIEGAGGILVPLNHQYFMVDLIEKLGCVTVVVSKNYLGYINHTLLTLEALKARNLTIGGIIFNGEEDKKTQNLMIKKYDVPRLLHLNYEEKFTSKVIKKYLIKLERNIRKVSEF